jgi:hypothetical protein
MNKSLRFLAAAGLIGGGCWVTSVWGQEGKPPAEALEPISVEPIPPGAFIRRDLPGEGAVGYGVAPRRGQVRTRRASASIEEMQAFHQAVEKLRSAKEGPDKEAAKKELLQLLEQSFTRDLEHREQEVAEVESRVKKLREQIERRKKAKDEIVGLRLKTIVNETEGLGFSGPQNFGPAPVSGLALDPASDDFAPEIKPDREGQMAP